MKFIALALIRHYQACISPLLPPACRFHPTCSDYACEAIDHWGVGRGILLAAFRLLRCHPFGGFGFDPVPVREDKAENLTLGPRVAPIEDPIVLIPEKADTETFEPEEVVTA